MLSLGGPHSAAVNFDTYQILQRHYGESDCLVRNFQTCASLLG